MMRPLAYLSLFICFLACGCEDQRLDQSCISGKIVGQKCDVFALQLPAKVLGATEWHKESEGGATTETFRNVIGLVDLPPEFRMEGKRLFVSIRKPLEEERIVPCYTDMPGPPQPLYIVLNASETSCRETHRPR